MIAVLIIDMVHEFVDGKFGSERAKKCAEKIERLLHIAREKGWKIVFTRDVHPPGDKEFRVWGEHCLKGDKGSELFLTPTEEDFVIDKMRYDAFYNSNLDTLLRNLNVRKIIIAGISTDVCVQHTASGAFFRGYDISICSDCTESIDEKKKDFALDYMRRIYGAEVINLEEVEKCFIQQKTKK